MRALRCLFVICLLGWGSAYPQSTLPPCQGSDVSRWDSCVGTFSYSSGHKSVGEQKDGKVIGLWTYTFGSGDLYVGEWKDGKFNGQGIQYDRKGDLLLSGSWDQDVLALPLTIDTKFFPFTSPNVRAAAGNQSAEGQMQTTASIPTAKAKCADIGFTPGTEGFGKCVLQLTK